MDKQFLVFMFCMIIFGFLSASIGHSFANKECTVTIKDHQGAYHVIKGVADAT